MIPVALSLSPTLAASWSADIGYWLSVIALLLPVLFALMLLALGSRLLRPFCVLGGIFGGGILGIFLGGTLAFVLGKDPSFWCLVAGFAGVFLGAICSYFFYRLILGLWLALLLALLTPLIGLTFNHNLPPLALDTSDLRASMSQGSDEVLHTFAEGLIQQKNLLNDWWEDLPRHTRLVIVGSMTTGAVAGLLLGIVAVRLAGAFLTSCVGASLIVLSINVAAPSFDDRWTKFIPGSPMGTLILLGLITALGLLLQYTIFRKKTDKTS